MQLEDRSWRNNVRLVNLPTGMEGDDPIGFLQKMLPKWIPELSERPCPIEIDRAHRVYSNSNSPKPRSMIFRLLRYPDRQAILQGARKAKPTLPGGTSLEFYADYSPETAQKRKAFSAVRAKLHQKGAETFLIYPALLMALFHCMVRHGTVHFWGVFHWVLYLVPDTFLVPLRSRFHRAVPLPKRDV